MRKILVCCSAVALFAIASPAAYATGKPGKGNGAHQNHTCQGGHNCNTTTPPAPTPPAPAAPAPSSSDSSSSVNVNTTTTVNVNVSAPAPAAAAPCATSCPATPGASAPVAKRKRSCKKIRVTRYRKVWHSGVNRCGDHVRWYTYKKVKTKRRVCV
jgi:hypothetical protein